MRISHSALTTFLDCNYKYFLHYLWKLRPTEQKSSLAFGDAVDVGLNHLLSTRNVAEALERFDARWQTYKDKDISYSKSDLEEHLLNSAELSYMPREKNWTSLLLKGRILIEEYHKQVMPRIKEVIAVQIDQSAYNDKGDELVIKTDFIAVWEDGRRILFDNKTSSIKYDKDSVSVSPQLGIYFEQLKADYNLDAAGYIVIPKKTNKKKEPRVLINVIIDHVSDETIQSTLEQYDSSLEKIKEGYFPKNKKACIGIYGKCPYYDFCHSGSKEGLLEKK